MTPGATAEMLNRYREIVIKVARKVDAGIVDIETNELWEMVKMHGINFDRYLRKKTGGGLQTLRQELQAENERWCCPSQSAGLEDRKMFKRRKGMERKHPRLCLRSRKLKRPKRFYKRV